jgi:hypothetical protein
METVRFAVERIGGRFSCVSSGGDLKELREKYGGFLFGLATQAATMATLGDITGAAAGVSAACVPIIVPIDTPLSGLDPRIHSLLSETPKKNAGRISTVSGIQISLAFAEIFLGDPVKGLSDLLQGGFGFYIVSAEGLPSLPTYTFISGLSGFLTLGRIQEMSLVSGKVSILTNYVTLSSACQPILCLLGCYYSWNLLISLRESLMPLTQAGMPLTENAIVFRDLSLPGSFNGRGRRVASLEQRGN